MSTNLPLRSLRPLYHRDVLRSTVIRTFSSTGAEFRSKHLSAMSNSIAIKAHNANNIQKSPGTSRSEAVLDSEDQLDDLGLFTGTFVRGNPPSPLPRNAIGNPRAWLEAFKTRGIYEYTWAKQRLFDVVGRYVYYFRLTNWAFRRRPIAWSSTIRNAANDNYERMYTAFAAKDTKELQEICIASLGQHFQQRLQTRPSDVKMTWELVRRDRRPRIVSHRATKLPPSAGQPDSRETPTGLRQVVLRMKTRQRLTVEHEDTSYRRPLASLKAKESKALSWSPDGVKLTRTGSQAQEEEIPDLTQTQDKVVVEYMVMQQRMLKGVLEPWKIWGFIEPSTLESLARDKEFELQSTAYQAAHPELS